MLNVAKWRCGVVAQKTFNRFSRCRGLESWNRNENFVPLQCQMKVVETGGIKGKILCGAKRAQLERRELILEIARINSSSCFP